MNELTPRRNVFWRIENIDSSLGEVLVEMKLQCRVPYGVENNIDVHISHHHPLLHDPFLKSFGWSSPRHPSCLHGSIWRGGRKCHLFCPHTSGLLLDSVLQRQGHSSSSSSSKSITEGVSSEAITLIKMFWIPDLRKGPTRLSSSKTRYRMVFFPSEQPDCKGLSPLM